MPDAGVPHRAGRILAAGAIVIAPFIAFLFRVEAGLLMMAVALGATSFLLHDAVDAVPPRNRRWIRLILAFNLLLALVCGVVALWLATGGKG